MEFLNLVFMNHEPFKAVDHDMGYSWQEMGKVAEDAEAMDGFQNSHKLLLRGRSHGF